MAELPLIAPPEGGFQAPGVVKPEPTAMRALAQESENNRWLIHQAFRDEQWGKVNAAIAQYQLASAPVEQKYIQAGDPAGFLGSKGDGTDSPYSKDLGAVKDQILKSTSGYVRTQLEGQLTLHYADDVRRGIEQHGPALAVGQANAWVAKGMKQYALAAATSPDPQERAYAMAQGDGMIDARKYWTDQEKADLHGIFHTQVDTFKLQKMISDDPSAAARELADPKFFANHPYIAPEVRDTMQNQVVSRSDFKYKSDEAAAHQMVDDNEQHITDLAQGGKPFASSLEDLRAHRGVSEDFYERMTGHPFVQTMPGLRDNYEAEIKTATTAELPYIEERAAHDADANRLATKDYSSISRAITIRRAEDKPKKDAAWSSTRDHWIPPIIDPLSKYDYGAKVNPTALKEFFDSAWDKDPATAESETNKHFEELMKASTMGTPTVGPASTRLIGGAGAR